MKRILGDRRVIALLLGPALLVYVGVMLVPVFWSLGYTFFTGNVISGFTFTGFDNFARLFVDPSASSALFFTLKYAVVITVVQIVLGYLLSLLYVFYLRKSSTLIRTLVFFPVALPTVAVALLFRKMFEVAPQNGLVNSIVNLFGVESIDWFGTADSAFWVIAIMDIWTSMGFYAVLLYAGILDVPDDVIESARIDGASGWRLVFHIVMPLSLPVLLSSIVFSINGSLKVFDSILALTNGGPGSSTTPLTLYMFRTAFSYGDYGYGSTVALALGVLCLGATLVVLRGARKDKAEER